MRLSVALATWSQTPSYRGGWTTRNATVSVPSCTRSAQPHAFRLADAAILHSLAFTHSHEVASRRVQGAVRGGTTGMASPARLLGYAVPVQSSLMAMPSPGRSAPPPGGARGPFGSPLAGGGSRRRPPPSLLPGDAQRDIVPDYTAPFAETQALTVSLRRGGV